MFNYICEEHNFITGNLHCRLTQRRLYTKVGKKIQNTITTAKVFSDFIAKEAINSPPSQSTFGCGDAFNRSCSSVPVPGILVNDAA